MEERKRGGVKLTLCLMPDTFSCHASSVITPCTFPLMEPPAPKVSSSWPWAQPTLCWASPPSHGSTSTLCCLPFLVTPNDAPNSQVSNPTKLKPGSLLKTLPQKALKQILLIFLHILEPGKGSVFLFCRFDALSSRTVFLKHMPSAWTTLSCSGCYWTFPKMLATDTSPPAT